MSFILKALKKVEEEKAARSDGPVDLNNALLRSGGTSTPSADRLARWGVIALVFVAGSGLTYVFVQKGSAPVLEPPRQTASPSTPSPLPSTPTLTEATYPPPAVPTAPPSAPSHVSASASPPETATTSPHPKRERPAPDEPRSAAAPGGSPPAGLKVNGIALQDDPDESVAVVNGALLKRGMTIEGARVEEIFADRVRFAGSGGIFDVTLSR